MLGVLTAPSATALLWGTGEAGRLIAGFPWETTSLGPLSTWPQSVITVVATILRSPVPIVTLWGEDGVMIYNDAYSVFAGARHPRLLGSKVREGWVEVADFNDNVMRTVLGRGETLSYADQELTLYRNGRPEQVWMNLDYSPILDEAGSRVGVMAIVVETTAKVSAERWQRGETERLRTMIEQTPGFSCLLDGPGHVFAIANQACLKLVGHRDIIGKTVEEALPELVSQGWVSLLDKVFASGEVFTTETEAVWLAETAGGEPKLRYLDFVYQPVRDASGVITGLYVQGSDVTERVLASQALAESEARFRLVAESAPVMLWMGDRFGGCVYLNRAQRDFWGVSEDFSAFSWTATLHPDDQSLLTGTFAEAMRKQTGFHLEARYRRADGAWRTLLTDASPRFAADGEFVGMIGVNVDVTEQRQAEAEQQKERRRLEILNATGAAIAAELNLDSIVQTVTDAAVALTGAQFGAFFYNVTDGAGESYMLYSLSGVERSRFGNFPMPRNTELFKPTFDGVGIVRSDDILTHPSYGRSAPYGGMPEGHLPVRSYLAVPVASRSGEVIGGLFLGHSETEVFIPEHEDLVLGVAGQAATAIDNARLFQAAEREVAERRRTEEALQNLNATLEQRVLEEVQARSEVEDQLRQIQKIEALGQLTGGIAHDFNNMLAVILGALNLLQRKLARGDSDVQRYVDAATEGAQRAATLTRRLLAFSRQQPLAPETLTVNKLVAGMSDLLGRALGEHILVETVLAVALWPIKVDPAQLENAILNLAVNARDAMPEGGKLTIETRNADIDESYARKYSIGAGQYVLVDVTDTGSGMPPEVVAKAFDPFFTTKEVGKGTGLGLSQVYGFVRQSGGHVKIHSEMGRGTSVKIYLPRYVGEMDGAEPQKRPDVVDRGTTSEVVLVVEDDPRVRALSVEALQELGYTVLEASGPTAALRFLEEDREISLLFTDVVMPEMSGRQLADIAREKRPDLPVLYATGYTRNAIVHDGRLDPGTNLLTKPFSMAELASKIRRILDGGAE